MARHTDGAPTMTNSERRRDRPVNCATCRDTGRTVKPSTLFAGKTVAGFCPDCTPHFDFASGRFVNCGGDAGEATPPTAPVPFDRAAHCRRIGSYGGVATVTTHGTHHMRVIGQTGARVTIERHGYDFWRGLMDAKGWQAPRQVSFLDDLRAGRCCSPTSTAPRRRNTKKHAWRSPRHYRSATELKLTAKRHGFIATTYNHIFRIATTSRDARIRLTFHVSSQKSGVDCAGRGETTGQGVRATTVGEAPIARDRRYRSMQRFHERRTPSEAERSWHCLCRPSRSAKMLPRIFEKIHISSRNGTIEIAGPISS